MLQEMLKLFYFSIYFILLHMCGEHKTASDDGQKMFRTVSFAGRQYHRTATTTNPRDTLQRDIVH